MNREQARRIVERLRMEATELRRTRADMLGTDDEAHFWACHDAARSMDEAADALEVAEAERDRLREKLQHVRQWCDSLQAIPATRLAALEMARQIDAAIRADA